MDKLKEIIAGNKEFSFISMKGCRLNMNSQSFSFVPILYLEALCSDLINLIDSFPYLEKFYVR